MEKKIKYQEIEITRLSGQSGLAESKFTLDNEYKKVTGVRAYLLANGGQSYIRIGLKDREVTYHNLTPNADWLPGVDYFYKPLYIENKGQDFYLSTHLPAANASDLKLSVVFRLEN